MSNYWQFLKRFRPKKKEPVYTEEDIRIILVAYAIDCITSEEILLTSDWLEQNKKK